MMPYVYHFQKHIASISLTIPYNFIIGCEYSRVFRKMNFIWYFWTKSRCYGDLYFPFEYGSAMSHEAIRNVSLSCVMSMRSRAKLTLSRDINTVLTGWNKTWQIDKNGTWSSNILFFVLTKCEWWIDIIKLRLHLSIRFVNIALSCYLLHSQHVLFSFPLLLF